MKNPLLIQIFIHTPNDDIVSFNNINPKAYIIDLKSQAELKTGILAELQTLYYGKIKVEDTKTFNEKNIKNGAVLRLRIKEKSLEQIYLNSVKGDIKPVFMLGVEFMKDDGDNSTDYEIDHMRSWNNFAPLRAFHALFTACFKGHLLLVTELLNKSAAHVKMVTKNGRSLLHIAASQGHIGCVGLLLGQGVDAKSTDREGMSALALAAENGHVKCEKRIWLFNWNMDVLTETDDKQMESTDDLEVQEVARRYRDEYKRTVAWEHGKFVLPRIINTKHQENKSSYQTNVTATFPKIHSQPRSSPTTKESGKVEVNEDMSSKIFTKLKETGNPVKQGIHYRTKTAPQLKYCNTPSRVSEWVDSTVTQSEDKSLSSKLRQHREVNLSKANMPQEIAGIKTKTNKEYFSVNYNRGKIMPELQTNQTNTTKEFPAIKTNIEYFSINNKRERTTPELQNADQLTKVPDLKQEQKKIDMKVVDSIDIQETERKKRKIITSRESIIKINERYKPDVRPPSLKRSLYLPDGFASKTNTKVEDKNKDDTGKEEENFIEQIQKENWPVIDINKTENNVQNEDREDCLSVTDSNEKKDELSKTVSVPDVDGNGKALIDGEETWRPESSFSFATTDLITYFGKKFGKTYGEWLEEKKRMRNEKQENKSTSFVEVKDMDDTEKNEKNEKAFEKWLTSKTRANSTSSEIKSIKKKRTYFGCSFEDWLEKKRNRPKFELLFAPSLTPTSTNKERERLKRGMPFDEWLSWKNAQYINMQEQKKKEEEEEEEISKSAINKNGDSFQKWLDKKEEQRIMENALKAIRKAQEKSKKKHDYTSRMFDPSQRTFEEWFLEKKYNNKREKKEKKNNLNKRYPEDSNLIFDMWLADKYMKDVECEKEKLETVRGSKHATTKSLNDILETYNSSDDSSESSRENEKEKLNPVSEKKPVTRKPSGDITDNRYSNKTDDSSESSSENEKGKTDIKSEKNDATIKTSGDISESHHSNNIYGSSESSSEDEGEQSDTEQEKKDATAKSSGEISESHHSNDTVDSSESSSEDEEEQSDTEQEKKDATAESSGEISESHHSNDTGDSSESSSEDEEEQSDTEQEKKDATAKSSGNISESHHSIDTDDSSESSSKTVKEKSDTEQEKSDVVTKSPGDITENHHPSNTDDSSKSRSEDDEKEKSDTEQEKQDATTKASGEISESHHTSDTDDRSDSSSEDEEETSDTEQENKHATINATRNVTHSSDTDDANKSNSETVKEKLEREQEKKDATAKPPGDITEHHHSSNTDDRNESSSENEKVKSNTEQEKRYGTTKSLGDILETHHSSDTDDSSESSSENEKNNSATEPENTSGDVTESHDSGDDSGESSDESSSD